MAKRAFALPGQKPLLFVAGVLAGLVLVTSGLAALAPWLFSTAALRSEIAARIQDMTGLQAVARGEPVFALLPRPHMSIEDVGFEDPSGALRVAARSLVGYLRVAALFTGRVEVARIRLNQPAIFIDTAGRPMPPDSAIGRAATAKSATPQASSTDEARLGAVELVDGTAFVRNNGGPAIRIDAINVTIDWPKLGAAARIFGRLGWNGETATIDATFGRPVDLIRGAASGLALHIAAPTGALSFEGLLASLPETRSTGRLVVTAPSAQALAALAGVPGVLPVPFDDLALSCDATISALGVKCDGLRLNFDGNEFSGALALRISERRPALSGSLSTENLSLRPFLARLPLTVGRDGQWSRAPFDLRPDRVPDLDLRIVAARVAFSGFGLEDARFAVASNQSRLAITIPTAKAGHGTFSGRAGVDLVEGEVELNASAKFDKIGLSASTRGSLGTWRIAGSMTGSTELASRGASLADLMRKLEGTAEIAVTNGEFSGIDLDRAFHRLEKRPLSLTQEIHHGATAFEAASFSLAIAEGIAEVENGRLSTPFVELAVGGSADIAERFFDLQAVATPGAEARTSLGSDSYKFRFEVAGSFDNPLFLPDVRSLIRRSGAAAPLFRHGRTRDAYR